MKTYKEMVTFSALEARYDLQGGYFNTLGPKKEFVSLLQAFNVESTLTPSRLE
jgi:hypothetical protein